MVFRYEKLGDFCFICGRLDHIDKDCPNLFSDEYAGLWEKKQYPPWLRADGLKNALIEELRKGLRSKRKTRWNIYGSQ